MGSEHRNAEKSITWEEELPYLPDSDILIINTSTISEDYVNSNEDKFYHDAQLLLFDMMMIPNKKIIVVFGGMVSWLPIYPVFRKSVTFDIRESDVENYLRKYLENVKTGNYYISSFYTEDFLDNIKRVPKESFDWGGEILYFELERKNMIRNMGNHLIGCTITSKLIQRTHHRFGQSDDVAHVSGEITFLPYPSEITPEEGVEILLNELLGIEPSESSPPWVDTIKLPNQEEIESQITSLYADISQSEDNIRDLKEKRDELIKYNRLLWTKGKPLENIVFDAFRFLDFEDIRMERPEDLEDGIFDFQTCPDFDHGVLEVKGADNRTALAHLTQCNKWVEDYVLLGKKAKGIFIPNQHRITEYPDSKEDRRHFEPNEFEYAESRKICILPAYELLEAIIEKLKNNPEITREKIEEKILNANGLCTLV